MLQNRLISPVRIGRRELGEVLEKLQNSLGDSVFVEPLGSGMFCLHK